MFDVHEKDVERITHVSLHSFSLWQVRPKNPGWGQFLIFISSTFVLV